MSLFADYLKERMNAEVIEKEFGFITYTIHQSECFIRDLFVHPDFRKQNYASTLADEVAEKAKLLGCTFLVGSVCPSAKGSTESLKILLAYGMTLFSCEMDLILFKKEIR